MNSSKVPNHIAIIPDGNRRWAKKRGLQPWLGHEKGSSMLIKLLENAINSGIPYITFWAASIDNLTKRNKLEVTFLLKVIKNELFKPAVTNFLHANKVKVEVLGEWKNIVDDEELKKGLQDLQEQTKTYKDNFLTILFAYDGKQEMLQGVRQAAKFGSQISEEKLRKSLPTGNLPDVDLVIRTGGQPHWSSGFMMWLTANSEFYFTETLWPDFGISELKTALKEYAKRDRKMGK